MLISEICNVYKQAVHASTESPHSQAVQIDIAVQPQGLAEAAIMRDTHDHASTIRERFLKHFGWSNLKMMGSKLVEGRPITSRLWDHQREKIGLKNPIILLVVQLIV